MILLCITAMIATALMLWLARYLVNFLAALLVKKLTDKLETEISNEQAEKLRGIIKGVLFFCGNYLVTQMLSEEVIGISDHRRQLYLADIANSLTQNEESYEEE